MNDQTLKDLSNIVKKRMLEKPKGSYVTELTKAGKVKIANKLGEEAFETVSAFLAQNKNEIAQESADLIFHLVVLLEFSDSSLDDVINVLKKRMKDD